MVIIHIEGRVTNFSSFERTSIEVWLHECGPGISQPSNSTAVIIESAIQRFLNSCNRFGRTVQHGKLTCFGDLLVNFTEKSIFTCVFGYQMPAIECQRCGVSVQSTTLRRHQFGYYRNGRFYPGCIGRQASQAARTEERAARRREAVRASNARNNPRRASRHPGLASLRARRQPEPTPDDAPEIDEVQDTDEVQEEEPVPEIVDLISDTSVSSEDEGSLYDGGDDTPAGVEGATEVTVSAQDQDRFPNECFCADPFRTAQRVLKCTNCDAVAHRHCLQNWYTTDQSCPFCRHEVRGYNLRPVRPTCLVCHAGIQPTDWWREGRERCFHRFHVVCLVRNSVRDCPVCNIGIGLPEYHYSQN